MNAWLRTGKGGAVAAMIGSAACWGGATVATKDVLGYLPPFTLLVLQLSASVVFLWIVTFVARASLQGLSPARAATGFLEPGLAYAAGVPGLALTGAASASVISATEPMVIAFIAVAFLRERLGLAGSLGLLGGVAGVILLTGSEGGTSRLAGDALIFAGVVFAALYVLASARLVGEVAPLPLAASQQTAGLALALAALAIAVATGWENLPGAIPLPVLAAALATGIVQYALAFWLYLSGMRHLRVTTAAQFLTLTPVFGVAGAMVFLGEAMTALQLFGAAVVVVSLVAVIRAKDA